jgi:tetratricopeptide (TPR) repeat protein
MKRMILASVLALAASLSSMAQQPPAKAAPKGPAPKSQGELTAVQALFNAQSAGPDAIIKATDELLEKYADTQFKEIALYLEAVAYQQKKDPVKAQIIAERVLEVNPKNYQAELMIGEIIATGVRENDLDKEEKLTKSEKFLNDAITNVKAADKPNPNLTDAQWEEGRKQLTAEAENDLGLDSLGRKKADDAVTHFRTANELDPQDTYAVRLASALQSAGKNDEAIAICDKLLANAQLHPAIKSLATTVKNTATAAKGGK